jgi:5-methylcytosine-specific restriction endonuclease McrA
VSRHRICTGCGAITEDLGRTRCPSCEADYQASVGPRIAEQNARKYERAKAAGRTSWEWRKIRAKVIADAGGECARCGAVEAVMSVHLVDGDEGMHSPDAVYEVLCRRCHGQITGGSRPGRTVRRAGAPAEPTHYML